MKIGVMLSAAIAVIILVGTVIAWISAGDALESDRRHYAIAAAGLADSRRRAAAAGDTNPIMWSADSIRVESAAHAVKVTAKERRNAGYVGVSVGGALLLLSVSLGRRARSS